MADNKEMQIEYDLFADIWKLFKGCYNPIDSEEYWNGLISASREIEAKYNSKFCNDLLVAVILELERKHNYLIGDSS